MSPTAAPTRARCPAALENVIENPPLVPGKEPFENSGDFVDSSQRGTAHKSVCYAVEEYGHVGTALYRSDKLASLVRYCHTDGGLRLDRRAARQEGGDAADAARARRHSCRQHRRPRPSAAHRRLALPPDLRHP